MHNAMYVSWSTTLSGTYSVQLSFLLFRSIAATCSSPCQNGGTCTGVDTCTCVVGWTGVLCETGKYVLTIM